MQDGEEVDTRAGNNTHTRYFIFFLFVPGSLFEPRKMKGGR